MFSHEQLVSGKNFQHLEDFVKHKWGSTGLDKFKSGRPVKLDRILEYKDYPFLDYVKCIESIQQLFDEEDAAYEVGEFRGRKLISNKTRSPMDRLQSLYKIEHTWHTFNNFAEVATAMRTPTRTSVIISRYNSHPVYCRRTAGFFHGYIAGKQKNICNVHEIRCVTNGDEACEFLVEVCQ